MKTKKKYQAPHVDMIQIDNEISLALQSLENPASGPGEEF